MPRRRLFVFGIISIVAFVTFVRAEPANRKFFVARGAGIECTDDPGGTAGAPCRRLNNAEINGIVTPQTLTKPEEPENDERSIDEDEDDDGNNFDDSTAVDEARGRKKRGRLLKVFFMMAAAAKATLLYAMIHAVALVAGKALVVAKIALALAATVALKKALEHHDTKTSYEIVKHPQHSFSQTHSTSVDYDHHGGYEGGHRRRRRHVR